LKLNIYDEEEKARAKTNREHQDGPLDPNHDNNMPPTTDELNATNEEEQSPYAPNGEVMHEQRQGYKYKS